MTPSVLRRRLPAAVNRGARLLDEREPGWAERINVGRLDMSFGCNCVVGQLHTGYVRGLRSLGLNVEGPDATADEVRYGFNLPELVDPEPLWADLDVLWRDAIRQRRAG